MCTGSRGKPEHALVDFRHRSVPGRALFSCNPCQGSELYRSMVDVETLTSALRKLGHHVESSTELPENAGGFEMMVDGRMLTLAEVRALLEAEQPE